MVQVQVRLLRNLPPFAIEENQGGEAVRIGGCKYPVVRIACQPDLVPRKDVSANRVLVFLLLDNLFRKLVESWRAQRPLFERRTL